MAPLPATNFGDKGTWSGGAATLNMKWTGGSQAGWKFTGIWSSSTKGYMGKLGGPPLEGKHLTAVLHKGADTVDGC